MLPLINICLGIFKGDILFISITTSCHRLSALSLLLEIETLVPLSLIRLENQFQKPQEPIQKTPNLKILFL